MSSDLKQESPSSLDDNKKQTNGLTDEQVKLLLAAAGRRKDDLAYVERLVEGAAEYRRLLQDQEAQTAEHVDK